MSENTPWECVIIGGGAAGLSAALMLGRARRRTLVLDGGRQSNLPAHGIGGLLGHDGLPPAELYARGRAELDRYPSVAVRDASVVAAERIVAADAGTGTAFVLTLDDGSRIEAGRVLLATGMSYVVPELPGIGPLWGDTVFHCPYCHGWEVRDGRLAVLGAGHAMHRALLLRGWSADVVLLTDGPADLSPEDRAALERAGIPVDERPVAALDGPGGKLAAVRFADGTERAVDGLLVLAPLVQRNDRATDLGATLTDGGVVDVDALGQTVVPSLYAAGDVGSPMPNVAGVIADGARAAAAINAALVAAEHGRPSVLPSRPEWAAA